MYRSFRSIFPLSVSFVLKKNERTFNLIQGMWHNSSILLQANLSRRTIEEDHIQCHQGDYNDRFAKLSRLNLLQIHISCKLALSTHCRLGHTGNYSATEVRFPFCRIWAHIMQLLLPNCPLPYLVDCPGRILCLHSVHWLWGDGEPSRHGIDWG